MTVARTEAKLVRVPPSLEDGDDNQRKVGVAADFSITDSSDTTIAIYVAGMVPYEIVNESGGSATLTFANATEMNGTALTKYDSDGVAVPALTTGDDTSYGLNLGLVGCTWLVITGASAGDHFTLYAYEW